MAGRLADEVVLSGDERGFREAQVRRHKAARSLSDRCRMIVLCAEGLQSKNVAERLGVHALRRPPPGCIHHTDRGAQYCAHDYRKLLRKKRVQGINERQGQLL